MGEGREGEKEGEEGREGRGGKWEREGRAGEESEVGEGGKRRGGGVKWEREEREEEGRSHWFCTCSILHSQVQELTLLIASYMEVFLKDINGKTSISCSPS